MVIPFLMTENATTSPATGGDGRLLRLEDIVDQCLRLVD